MFRQRLLRLSLLLVLLVGTAAVTDAYTLVLRSGRLVQIPEHFVVTGTTLTYEVANGIQVTLLLRTIDVAATELRNNEPAGSFMKHAITQPVYSPLSLQRAVATSKSITNRDLEPYVRNRSESDMAYNRRSKDLGLPSIEEVRKNASAEAVASNDRLMSMVSRQNEAEDYWRMRSSELRAEIAATDARISFLRGRISELPSLNVWNTWGAVVPFIGLSSSIVAPSLRPAVGPRPMVYTAPNIGPQLGARANFGNTTMRGPSGFNGGRFHGGRVGGGAFPFGTTLSLPFGYYDSSYERSDLVRQLDELLEQRAALQARWRVLEDEARRAGAYPGWLRP